MEKIFAFFLQKEVYMTLFNIVIYIIIGYTIYGVLKGILVKSLKKNKKKKQQTITKLLISTLKVTIIIFEMLLILNSLGIDVSSIIAGLGIVSVVLGLALQDIMKDILAGIFIIIDDQYDVGDVIEVNGYTGTVISVGFKTTKIKNYQGKLKIISNRNILEVTNLSKSNSFAIVDIPFPYEENIKTTEQIINKIIKRIEKDISDLQGPIQMLGITELASSSINHRIMVETKPVDNFRIEREIKKIIKEEFDRANISIPYNKLEVINGK